MNDLKFTSAGEYMRDIEESKRPEYYINESGLKIDARTGNLYELKESLPGAQCSPP